MLFRRNKKLVPDEEIFETRKINSFGELLQEGHSLCLIYRPQWIKEPIQLRRFIVTLKHSETHRKATENIQYAFDEAERQSVTKNRLDRYLKSEYMFSSWKKSGFRTFKIIRNGKVIKDYDSFNDAVDELMPFMMEYDFVEGIERRLKYTGMRIFALQLRSKMERKDMLLRLIDIIKQRREELKKNK